MRLLAFGLAGIAAIAAAGVAAQVASSLPAMMAGVYKIRFQNGTVDGEKYTSENILEVVPVGAASAYFRLHLEFFNGHECALSGVADAAGRDLVYHGPPDVDGHPCALTLRHGADGVRLFEAENGACRAQSCGARGGYGYAPQAAPDFPITGRRAIRYLPRLLASTEYQEAIKEHAARPR
jgi:hypothetical protein